MSTPSQKILDLFTNNLGCFNSVNMLTTMKLSSTPVYMKSFSLADDEEELVDRNLECCGRCWPYYIPWLRFQNALFGIVSDIMFELFITLCIALNVLAMAIEHYGQPITLQNVLTYLNYVSKGVLFVLSQNALAKFSEINSDPVWDVHL